MSDDCIICGKWPEADHWALREMLDTLPLNDQSICDRCQTAFWRNMGLRVRDAGMPPAPSAGATLSHAKRNRWDSETLFV